MKARLLLSLALAALVVGCGKENGSTTSTSTTKATVNYQALAGADAASITFDALSPDMSKSMLTDKVSSFDVTASGHAFSGLVQIDPGAYVFRAKAFDKNGVAIGEGEAENAAPITTTKGQRTSISITVKPYQAATTSAPVVSSFVVSPTGPTLMVNTPVTMKATVQYGGTGTLTYKWSQNAACLHGVFSTPTDGLSATWSDSAEETCTLSFTATDPGTGLSDTRSVTLQCSCLGASQLAGGALTACP